MKTTLFHTFTQLDSKGNDQSLLTITVEYDTKERRWTQLISVTAIDCKTKVAVDITHIFFNTFHGQAEQMIDSIDWPQVYADQEPRRNTWTDLNPVFEKIFETHLK